MRKAALIGMFILCMLILVSCGKDKGVYINFERSQPIVKNDHPYDENQRPIRIAVATVVSSNETIEYYRHIANYIAKQTGKPTILIQRKTYEELNMVMSNGEADIAFMSTGAYCAYRGLTEIELLAMVEYNNCTFFDMKIIVHKDSDIHSLDDLQGKRFAFTDPLSYSGRMVVRQLLKDRNTRPEKYFSRYIYTYGHDKSIWAVANKATEAASIDSMILDNEFLINRGLVDKIRVIHTVGPNPTGPVAIRSEIKAEQKEQYRQVFLNMHKDSQMTPSLKGLLIDRFVVPDAAYYRPLQKIYDQVEGII